MRFQKPSDRIVQDLQLRRHLNPPGNVLIYVVVLMLIFGVLGVVMVSLFTSTTASTVTRNDSRRARYMAESGMRYAFSEMRKADFDLNHMINTLNTTTYQIGGTESFKINVFSPWFEADGDTNNSAGGPLPLLVPIGTVPVGYTVPIPPDSIYAVNFEFTGLNPTDGGRAVISGYSIPARPPPPDTLTLNLSDGFYANSDERIAFGVQPAAGQIINAPGVDLDLPLETQYFLPKYGGAISIRRNDYFYEERKEEPEGAPTKVVLKNLSKASKSEWLTSQTDANDWVVMSPRNYLVVPTGTSDGTIYGGDYLFGKGIYDASLIRPGSAPPDITAEDLISNLSEQETDTRFFETDLVDFELDIGGGRTNEFGSAFFNADMSIGGDQDYCQQGACKFALGVRVFFLLDFNKQGDGITFTLLNASGKDASDVLLNSVSSVGGDLKLSELMGYAGDSRLDEAGTIFLATNEDDRGLDPPKIAVEFDTQTNKTAGDPPPDYCADISTANEETRNDPIPFDPPEIDPPAIRDMVQYVFWGRTSGLIIPCRDNNALYDDNRHDAVGGEPTEEWSVGTGGPISVWRPAIGPDGTIYASDQVDTLYAFDEEGNVKWTFNLGDGNDYMPGIDRTGNAGYDGTIYSDIFGSALVAINPNGTATFPYRTEKWRFSLPNTDVESTPTVGADSVIYFGTKQAQTLYALNPNGTQKWRFPTGGEVNNVPALSPDGTTKVYFVSNDNFLYALNTAARSADLTGVGGLNFAQGEWRFPILTEPNEIQSSPTVKESDGTIYVGADDGFVYALKEAARQADPTGVGGVNGGLGEWRFGPIGEVESSAALDPDDGTIYIGSDDGYVYAITPNGMPKWRFRTNGNVESSPIVDVDGTVYIGSNDGNVYALKTDARLADGTQDTLNALAGEWAFSTGGSVPSSPALGQTGFIHIGSDDTNFYTISQYANPRNFKDKDKNLGKLLIFEDLDSSVGVDSKPNWLNGANARGSWAVRLEVECLLRDADEVCTSNADGDYEYELRLWIRQCPDQNDFPCGTILGTYYVDTRFEYDYTAVKDLPMVQRIRLSSALSSAKNGDPPNDGDFYRFFFGFTGAAGAEALDATISNFELSFIRPGDTVIDCDKMNWPIEPPPKEPAESDCTLLN